MVSDEPIIKKEKSIFPEVVCALERAQALEFDGPDLYCVILGSHLTSLSLSFAVAGYQYQPHRVSLEQRSFLFFFFFKFYLFIYGCVGSSSLCEGFL